MAPVLPGHPSIVAAAVYADASHETSSKSIAGVSIPIIQHFAGNAPAESNLARTSSTIKEYYYPKVTSYKFATPFLDSFHYNTEAISHTRTLTFFKPIMGGPFFDLEAIWEDHCYYEFADRSMEHTMSTMVQEPYVNHVPTVSHQVRASKKTFWWALDQSLTRALQDNRWHRPREAVPLLPAQLHLQQLRRRRARAGQPDCRCRSCS